MTKKRSGNVKAWRFEIIGLARESRTRWHDLQDQSREIVNLWWQLWCARHVMAGNNLAIVDWMRAFRAARQVKDKPPECPVPIMPVEIDGAPSIYRIISGRFRSMHTRTIVLLQNLITKRITGKDCDGVWNLWQSVLACRQGQPGCERDQPIPFDKVSSTLPVRVDDRDKRGLRGSKWRFDVTLAREEVDGERNCASIHETFTVLAKGSGEAIISRIANGEYAFRGSQIFYSQSSRKWFATLCYAMPAHESHSPGNGTMVLRPGLKAPWKIRARGRSDFRGGYGRHVTATRRRLLTDRWTGQETYRWSGSARRGHGRRRALGPIEKLRNAWRKFVTGYNARLTTEIVRECVQKGIGKLFYCQPAGKRRDTRFLSIAGKIPERRDASLWDWHQIGNMLAWKCKEAGIHLVVRKSGEPRAARCAQSADDDAKEVARGEKTATRKGRRNGIGRK